VWLFVGQIAGQGVDADEMLAKHADLSTVNNIIISEKLENNHRLFKSNNKIILFLGDDDGAVCCFRCLRIKLK